MITVATTTSNSIQPPRIEAMYYQRLLSTVRKETLLGELVDHGAPNFVVWINNLRPSIERLRYQTFPDLDPESWAVFTVAQEGSKVVKKPVFGSRSRISGFFTGV